MRVYTSEQMKQIEANANADGINYLQMMENAGCACARAVIKRLLTDKKKTVIICGKGKNGGDGFVAASYLKSHGFEVSVILAYGLPQAQDAEVMFKKLEDVEVVDFTVNPSAAIAMILCANVVIDAVFGFGFKGKPDETAVGIFSAVNLSPAKVVAIDLPSGVECDTAAVNGGCIKADLTLAISHRKPAHILLPAAKFCGETVTVNIGIGKEHCEGVDDAGFFTFTKDKCKLRLPERDPRAHKGDFGKVLSVCGSKKYAGAAVLAALGAVKTGAGLVTAAFPEAAYPAIGSKLTEPILMPLPCCEDGFLARGAVEPLVEELSKSDVLLIGCGLGQTLGTSSVLTEVLNACECAAVIDADGINLLHENINVLERVSGRAVLTPHPGEFARLLGLTVEQVEQNRLALAKAFAKKFNVVLVLKGANTIVAGADECYVNCTGNAGMARGGCGDLLAGMVAGLIAQGIDEFHAAVTAVFIHGLAGDEAAAKLSQHGMTPSDMLALLPELLSDFE